MTSFDTPPQPLKVLVAEDNLLNQQLIVQMLDHLGYSAECVSDGLAVLEALRKQSYYAVFMDVQMPQMDGIRATQQIRQEWLAERQPYIIALTGRVSQEEQAECLQVGMNDCLTKPIRLEAMAAALSRRDAIARQSPPAIAAETLAEIRQIAGEDWAVFLVNAIDAYLAEAPILLKTIQSAIASAPTDAAQSPVPGLPETACSLKTMSGFLGAIRLAQLCQTLEDMAKSSITSAAEQLVQQMAIEYENVKTELEIERQKALA